DWRRPISIHPEESASIDWPSIGLPRGRDRLDVLHVAFGQQPLAVPDTILKVEVTQSCPVARGDHLVALAQEIAVRVGLDNGIPDPDLVEERPLREGVIVLAPLLHTQSHQVA